ncbi:MAG: biotin synthase [Burkholderiales bacterium]
MASPPPHPHPQPLARRVDAAALQRHLRHTYLRGDGSGPWLHAEIGRRMADRLAVIKTQPQAVIDWWALHGASTGTLRKQYPQARIEAVTPAGFEQAAAVPARRWWQRLWPAAAPAGPATSDQATLPASAHLLWANMMLHWVDDLPPLLERWHAAVQTDGFLMFSCFGPDTLRELRALYAACGLGPPGSAFIDMHDLGDALVHAGFADPVMDMEMLRLSWADAEALLAELRDLGHNTAIDRAAGLRTPRWRARLLAQMTQQLRGSDGRLHLSFEVVYGHAFKPAPRPRVAEQTAISLDDMRTMVRAGSDRSAAPKRPD